MPAPWRSLISILDAATAVCAAFNLAYFHHRLAWPGWKSRPRRVAALALLLVSLAAAVESLVFLAAADVAGEESARWTLVRALSLAGTAGITALVLRRLAGGR
jgi:hypothetical protein